MQTVRHLLLLSCLEVLLVSGCSAKNYVATKPRMTEAEVLKIAKAAMIDKFSNLVAKYEPYHVQQFSQGTWAVFGTVPDGILGGGAPCVDIEDSDGKILKVYLAR